MLSVTRLLSATQYTIVHTVTLKTWYIPEATAAVGLVAVTFLVVVMAVLVLPVELVLLVKLGKLVEQALDDTTECTVAGVILDPSAIWYE